MQAVASAFKYRPSATMNGRNEHTIAQKLARGIRKTYTARMVSPHTYIIVDEAGQDIPDTTFTVTEQEA